MKKVFRLSKVIFINALLLGILLVVIDFFLGMKWKINQERTILLREHRVLLDYFEKPNDTYLSYCDNLEQKKYKVRTDENGFIIGEKNLLQKDQPVDLFFFGGSTTECIYVDEEKRFPYLVQTKLNKLLDADIKVLNAGVSGNHTMHSTFNLLSKGISQSPKIVVLMHNINDLALLEKTGSYWNAPNTRAIVQSKLSSNFNRIRNLKNALIPNIYRFVNNALNAGKSNETDEWEGYRDEKKISFDVIENEFEKSIYTFIDIAKRYGIKVILMTQFNRVNLQDDFTLKHIEDKEHFTEFVTMYHKLNEKIRKIAEKENVGLIDLSEKVPSNKEYIYDDVHLNTNGSEFVASIITEYLHKNYFK
jgi:lysophospholipase L1-like esterase